MLDPFSLAGLSDLEADLLAAATAVGIIGNGGHRYWYEGMGHQETLRAAVALDRMGAPEAADALRRSWTTFPGANEGESASRLSYLEAHRDELDKVWESLDRIVWAIDWHATAARYILLHRDELLALNPDFASDFDRHAADQEKLGELLSRAFALQGGAPNTGSDALSDETSRTAMLRALVAGGEDQSAAFWQALQDAARLLGDERCSDECGWWLRVGREGGLLVEAEFVKVEKLGRGDSTGYYSGHKVRWNIGADPESIFRSSAAELFVPGIPCLAVGEPGRVYLVPPRRAVPEGAPVVLHEKGEAIGRGIVIRRRHPIS
jgi:hypothetical protein